MKLLSSNDIRSGLITGLTTGIIAWRILVFLGASLPLGVAPGILVPLIPSLWLAGVQLGYALGAWYRPFIQFGKFCAIGFTNAAVDFGVLYLLIAATGLAAGVAYTVFKTVSFAVSVMHSYLWNKYWAFDASGNNGGGRELVSFITVAVLSMAINVTVASLVVVLGPFGFSVSAWAGVGAIAGSAVALIFSFIGFRIFVFKSR